MILRNYQNELINKTRLSLSKNKRVLVVLPCGGGKTVCFAYMAKKHIEKNSNNFVLFLVHRKELMDQALNTIGNIKNCEIAMVQSISKNLENIKKPTMIIIDEAHHSTANQYKKIINYFPEAFIIGLTATPCRQNGDALGNIFQDLIIGVDSDYLIENNFLSKYDYYAPKFNIPEPELKGSDFDVSNIVFDKKIYGNILNYIDYNKKTIIYCPNIRFSSDLARQIPNSVHFDGNTDKMERERIINDFRDGKIRVLLNVDLIGEGFDVPDCDCVILLRPTQSTSLYIQQSMRCLRYKENKKAVIYDLVGNVFRHGLPTEKREWCIDKKIKVKNPSGEPDIITRMCNNCYRVYSGNNPICPYCNYNNGKTPKQLEIEKNHELEKITKLEQKHKRIEVAMCKTLNDLINLGKKRNYKNPEAWAYFIFNGRKKHDKRI